MVASEWLISILVDRAYFVLPAAHFEIEQATLLVFCQLDPFLVHFCLTVAKLRT